MQQPPATDIPRELIEKAADWIAALHGPDRSVQMELECLAWQARSPLHRAAYQRCSAVFQSIPGAGASADVPLAATTLRVEAAAETATPTARLRGPRWALAAVFVGVAVGVAAVYGLSRDAGVFSTGVGEQQQVLLDDGTRVSLNTATRARVAIDAKSRVVSVEAGEALFEVARDTTRPFIVKAGGSEVVALGTVFAVRYTPDKELVETGVAVTLLKGSVEVRAGAGAGAASAPPVLLVPGQRLRVQGGAGSSTGGTAPQVDRPNLDQVVAWRRSEAVFSDVSMAQAVAEMNRYNRTPVLLLGDEALKAQRVSGRYPTNDAVGFANGIAGLHGLRVVERPDRIEISAPQ